jgi:hypothetical protein
MLLGQTAACVWFSDCCWVHFLGVYVLLLRLVLLLVGRGRRSSSHADRTFFVGALSMAAGTMQQPALYAWVFSIWGTALPMHLNSK